MTLCKGAQRAARRRLLHEKQVSYDEVKYLSPGVVASARLRVVKLAGSRAQHRNLVQIRGWCDGSCNAAIRRAA